MEHFVALESLISKEIRVLRAKDVEEVFLDYSPPLEWDDHSGSLRATKEPGKVWTVKVKFWEYSYKSMGLTPISGAKILSTFLVSQTKDRETAVKNIGWIQQILNGDFPEAT